MKVRAQIPNYATINKRTLASRWRSLVKSPLSLILFCLVVLSAVIAAGMILFIIAYILVMGLPSLSLEMFSWKFTTENCSMLPALINTLIMIAATLIIAVPIGIFSAIYLVEYAKKGNRLVSLIRLTTETLSGIPSIIFGLFGNILFVEAFGWRYSLLAGILTLAIMVLPLIIRTTEEALLSVFTAREALDWEPVSCARCFVSFFPAPRPEFWQVSCLRSGGSSEKARPWFLRPAAGPVSRRVRWIPPVRFRSLCIC